MWTPVVMTRRRRCCRYCSRPAAAVASAAAWSERLRKVLVRPRSSAGVHAIAVDDSKTALTLIVQSIRAATYDLEGTGEPPESEEGQFCLCRQPGGREMLGCDVCGDWYHLRCAGVTAGFARGAKNYVCQACLAAQGDVFKLNKPDVVYKHIHRTRRPTLTVLGEMLLEALEFSGKLPEEDLLVDVFVEHQKWRTAGAGVLKRRGAAAGVEGIAQAAKEKADAAARALAAVRDARLARIKGVQSAMPMFKALKLCPDATVIRPDMEKYGAVGRQIREMMRALTPLVEPLSIDEAFLDLTGTRRLHHASPAQSLILLVNRIEREIGVTASIGLSYNKFLAKLASDMDKPRGFAAIGRGDALDVLDRMPVTRIWGVGAALHRKLTADGLHTIGQIRTHDEKRLVERYGAIGRRLARFSHGEDARTVTPHSLPKNLSSETTFADDISDPERLAERLWPLCEKVTDRMKARDLAGRTVTVKLKSSKFKTLTRSQALPAPTQLAETLYRAAVPLLDRAIAAAPKGSAFRLIGVGLSNFADPREADPPDLADPDSGQRKRVEAVIDQVRDKLGHDAIGKGRAIRARRPKA